MRRNFNGYELIGLILATCYCLPLFLTSAKTTSIEMVSPSRTTFIGIFSPEGECAIRMGSSREFLIV